MAPGFTHFEGHKLAYETYGKGNRAVVLIHGLLMSRRMQEPLAHALAEQGNMAITIDLAGHGNSDAPLEHWDIPRYAAAIDSLLQELEIKEAVMVGTSLGANIALELGYAYPGRVRGIVAEMPALENAMIGGPLFFGPVAAVGTLAEPVAKVLSRGVRLLPTFALPFGANVLLDLLRHEPKVTVDIIKGLFLGPLAPSVGHRKEIDKPVLVIGHHHDPVHPFSDAEQLAEDLPDARLIEASSIVELRLTPARLTGEVIDFVDDCWRPRAVAKDGSSGRRKRRKSVT